ncbi:14369_t:CDS:2 [Funneliformis geosporum]|uniref:14369_t:CDS:1 n=1 Tax=Funneliformis geosporum TaxID=1117311 RepID=A0A9W4T118_9GLOM|nr:14369_t:CDS:2 [Funneliformis geosporum]
MVTMVDYTNILRSTLENGSGMVKFFKTLEYTFSQRDQAEKDLKRALETISSENGELSSKALEWLRNFDVMIKSSSTERHWTSTKVNEECEKTHSLELISAEKEEQHFYNVMSNIAVEHDSASDNFRARTQERFNKRPSSFEESLHELDSNKKMKLNGTTPDNYETSADTEQETDEVTLIDPEKFKGTYLELDPNQMWTLKSGRKVEEIIYEFARNLSRESYLHSFIINDVDVETKSLFTKEEWKEITTSEVKNKPSLEQSHMDLLKTIDNVEKLQEIIFEPFMQDGSKYDKRSHFDLNYINYSYRGMLFLWQKEENPFDSEKLEGWYEMNVWSHLIDPAFHNLNIDLGDGVFRLCKDRLEFGAIETGRKWEGEKGTKYMHDSLKMCKMLKDMVTQLAIICDGREELVRKLEVVGILHGANRIQIITMDYPKGYISRIKRRKFCKVPGRLTNSTPLALVLKEILYAKSIISRVLYMINHKDDVNLENFLNDSSDEQGECHTSSPRVNIPPTFSTPKKKKPVIN